MVIEKNAPISGLCLPISVRDIIDLPMDEFNDLLSKHELTEEQLTLCREIRRRGKNKVCWMKSMSHHIFWVFIHFDITHSREKIWVNLKGRKKDETYSLNTFN